MNMSDKNQRIREALTLVLPVLTGDLAENVINYLMGARVDYAFIESSAALYRTNKSIAETVAAMIFFAEWANKDYAFYYAEQIIQRFKH